MTNDKMNLVIIGGGAAGFMAAITAAEANPRANVLILEKSHQLLSKVRISGGGRCNETHACFDPAVLIQSYPRGAKEYVVRLRAFNRVTQWNGLNGAALN